MWKSKYKQSYKTRDPQIIVTAVRSFPNTVNTVEKARECYRIDKVQNSETYRRIYADFAFHNGNDFIPVALEDDVPKLAKLAAIQPVGGGYFWCLGYIPEGLSIEKGRRTYNSPSHSLYREWLEWWIAYEFKGKYDGIAGHLFRQSVSMWVHEESKDFSDELKSRRFKFVANSSLRLEYPEDPSDYITFIDKMYKTNWYEFVFKQYY